ncbi:hypothetical protein QR90_04180 [Deinococcus radiopugnans]|uniref:DUF2270 domain-containing protein n=3 Tax=Deinococcus radiopugnans TaxID=57497 RepID=A0A0A7KK55_9DEIO|nr:DUF2270 domain-containing protein [Deinococcus radiopugnans]AIZ46455.1 hypothetical protein QR90_04180 [Deinococcus radiopugnans]QLG10079.1 DUF2270 domain-containing protein [Deinococcus sp. D7000]TNM68692.1 DUF2270 domain-containing protein [Deinococcus radiopugnans ATCC 19172]
MPGAGGGAGAVLAPGLTEVSYSTNQANALIHLYRAEVGKMTAWRQRLDMTTNWSVVTSAGLASFALGDVGNSHATFLFAMFMNYFFLRLEARRFRTYEIAHHRVRIMERFFYPAMLGDKVDPGWHQLLLAELGKPRSPMSRNDALGWRLGRNYLWIYAAVLLAWFAKLDLEQPKGYVLTFPDAFSLADIGNFPGWLVFAIVGVFYLYLIWLAVRAARTYPLEEG